LLSQHIGTNCTYLEWQSPVVFKAGSRDLQHGHHLETCLDSQLSPIPTELEILGWGSATCFNKPRSFTLHVTFQDSLLYLVPLALLVVRHTVLRLSQGSCWPGGTVEGLVYAQPTKGPPIRFITIDGNPLPGLDLINTRRGLSHFCVPAMCLFPNILCVSSGV
jgi:hypothetical protein